MRTIVDFPKEQLDALDRLRDERKVSRAELIRHAVSRYLQEQTRESLDDLPGFGCWSNHLEDGLEYQRRIRQEWER